jgi:hypothetical protein
MRQPVQHATTVLITGHDVLWLLLGVIVLIGLGILATSLAQLLAERSRAPSRRLGSELGGDSQPALAGSQATPGGQTRQQA